MYIKRARAQMSRPTTIAGPKIHRLADIIMAANAKRIAVSQYFRRIKSNCASALASKYSAKITLTNSQSNEPT